MKLVNDDSLDSRSCSHRRRDLAQVTRESNRELCWRSEFIQLIKIPYVVDRQSEEEGSRDGVKDLEWTFFRTV